MLCAKKVSYVEIMDINIKSVKLKLIISDHNHEEEKRMKKLLCIMCCGILTTSLGIIKVSANEGEVETIPDGFDSAEQYEQVPDYYDAERIEARNEKYAKANQILKQRKNVYSISLPLRAQQDRYWCAAAVGEMIIDYQLGSDNIWTQAKIAKQMKTDATGAYVDDQATALRQITGLNFEVTRLSDYSFANALRADINSYVGLSLPVNLYYIYSSSGTAYHSLAAKGYSDANTVIFLDPWVYDSSRYGQHEISISQMTTAIDKAFGIYIW